MDRVEISNGQAFLMATPEKALADKLNESRGVGLQTQKELYAYLENNLRINPAALEALSPTALDEMARRYQSRRVRLLGDLVKRVREKKGRGAFHA
jgi:hypothetical protein